MRWFFVSIHSGFATIVIWTKFVHLNVLIIIFYHECFSNIYYDNKDENEICTKLDLQNDCRLFKRHTQYLM